MMFDQVPCEALDRLLRAHSLTRTLDLAWFAARRHAAAA